MCVGGRGIGTDLLVAALCTVKVFHDNYCKLEVNSPPTLLSTNLPLLNHVAQLDYIFKASQTLLLMLVILYS